MTYVGEPLRSLSLLDEAESLDPLLPVWCIEERGVASMGSNGIERRWRRLEGLYFRPIVHVFIERRR